MQITFDALALEVVRLAEESPEYVYPGDSRSGCSYTTDRNIDGQLRPPCLFGQALMNLGTSEAILCGAAGFIPSLMEELGIETTSEQSTWAMKVQGAQDGRLPWGEAITIGGPIPLSNP